MPTWDAVQLSPARVRQAHRSTRLVRLAALEAEDGPAYAFVAGIEATVPEAKELVETEVMARMGKYVTRYASPRALMDAIAAETTLADSVQTVLAYAFLHSEQFSGRNTARDVYDDDAKYFLVRMQQAVKAMAETAPYVLGLTGRSGRVGVGGALASTMSARGCGGYDHLGGRR